MPQHSETPTAEDDAAALNDSLGALLPEMRRVARQGWGMIVALGLCVLVVVFGMGLEGEAQLKFGLFAVVGGGALMVSAGKWVRRRHEAMVLPIIARTAGLDYEQNAKYFIDAAPTRLLPRGIKKCEDLVQGRVGNRRIEFGECQIETGGKNSTTLFRGIVAQFPNLVEMPAFFIVGDREIRTGFFSRGQIKVDDLTFVRSVSSGGDSFSVYCAEGRAARMPGFDGFLDIVVKLGTTLSWEGKLFAASSDGRTTWLALRHPRDLFRLGGLTAQEEAIVADVRMAHHDVMMPLKIVSSLLDAEAQVLAAARPAAVPDPAAMPAGESPEAAAGPVA